MNASSLLLRHQEIEEYAFEAPAMGTMTSTSAREEKDQDPRVTAGTRTQTRTKEESDQDACAPDYFVFPRE